MNFIDFQLILDNFWFVFSGLPYTLGIALASFLTGLVLGFFISRARMSDISILSSLARFYIRSSVLWSGATCLILLLYRF